MFWVFIRESSFSVSFLLLSFSPFLCLSSFLLFSAFLPFIFFSLLLLLSFSHFLSFFLASRSTWFFILPSEMHCIWPVWKWWLLFSPWSLWPQKNLDFIPLWYWTLSTSFWIPQIPKAAWFASRRAYWSSEKNVAQITASLCRHGQRGGWGWDSPIMDEWGHSDLVLSLQAWVGVSNLCLGSGGLWFCSFNGSTARLLFLWI